MTLTLPRIFTPPLRDLSESDATWGYDFAWFCREILHSPLSDYQEWLGIHVLEVLTKEDAVAFAKLEDNPEVELAKVERLYAQPVVKGGRPIPNGRLRFTYVLILISRQNGKTDFVKKLIKYFFFRRRVPEIMAAAQTLNKAIDLWNEILLEIELDPVLSRSLGRVDHSKGGQAFWSKDRRRRYRPVGIDENAGRGDTNDLLYIDELRTQKTYVGVNSLEATTTVPDNGLIVATSNAGGDHSVVLRETRERATAPIKDGTWRDARIAIFEWSADPDKDIDDQDGWREANPDLGNGRITLARLAGFRQSKSEAAFRTEHLCQWDSEIDREDFVPILPMERWGRLAVDREVKVGKLVLAVEAAPDDGLVSFVSAGQTVRGVHIQLLHTTPTLVVDDAVRAIADFRDGCGPCSVLLDKDSPAGVLQAPLAREGIEVVAMTGARVSAAWRSFEQAVRDGTLTHDGNPQWVKELGVAVLRGEDGKYPAIDRFSGEVPSLVAATFAVWGLNDFLAGYAAGRRKAIEVEEVKMNPVGALPRFAVRHEKKRGGVSVGEAAASFRGWSR
ncbi:hypothetical protein I6I10_07335 [Corynebacterium glucuronolyticum]|uniref:Phage terminase-like protein, large subunit, contains N-terminal HTH domain n=1 Tax=Corynebacterium glucuronolyticum TaxID=39791 RepID=A0A7T4ED61_9CORY|nr:hypothetical protein [Corynebacterium glucuronolyticum]QQB45350.1 hypothetical protein I6I10_07335 [Corynebacterium glucuronolyticum]WKD64034.1 Phage Terminase [Corynebacterium glucuronolyticum DSM 44120]SMB81490.1 Phage terminase-like protein, large subunit, contains N-terminal HTH domain [Corynebacterium glucuronolyticum]